MATLDGYRGVGICVDRPRPLRALSACALWLLGCVAGVSSNEDGDWSDVVATQQEIIFGVDNRLEYEQLGSRARQWADATAQLISASSLLCDDGGQCGLLTTPYTSDGAGNRLCNSVRFRGQPQLNGCTAYLVGPNLMMTAAHCIRDASCADARFTFGYRVEAGIIKTLLPASDVYSCSSIVATSGDLGDWALVRLDRPVTGPRWPLNVRRSISLAAGTPLSMPGHPRGLPLKHSSFGSAVSVPPGAFFNHSLEASPGNSGSPVIDDDTGVVEGTLAGGDSSMEFVASSDATGPCRIERVCPSTGCPGAFTTATHIALASSFIPLTAPLIMTVMTTQTLY